MLLNLTNHPYENWQDEQKQEALRRWERVEDCPFPVVSPEWDTEQVSAFASETVRKTMAMKPDAVLCQGEMCLTFSMIADFQRQGVPVFAATSERVSMEVNQPDGSIRKQAVFRFVRFREYERIGG